MLGHLRLIDPVLGESVEKALRMQGRADTIVPAREPLDLPPSPALSIAGKRPETIEGRSVAVLVSDGADAALLARLRSEIESQGGEVVIVAPWIGGVKNDAGEAIAADHAVKAAPSVLFDAIVLAVAPAAGNELAAEVAAVDFVREAFRHLKVIGFTPGAAPLLEAAGIARGKSSDAGKYGRPADDGVVELAAPAAVARFIEQAKHYRIWSREELFHPR